VTASTTTLDVRQVASVFNGKTPAKSEQRDRGYPVLKIKDVNAQGRFQGSFSGRVDAQFAKKYPKQQLVGGETLILNAAHSATHVASKTFYAEQDVSSSLATGEWLIVRWNMEAVDSRYGNYWINSPETRFRLRRLVKGIHLYPRDVARLKVPLPPLAEQQRIAAILDTADAVRRKRQQALALTDELLQSTFLDMFGDPVTNPKGWESVGEKDTTVGHIKELTNVADVIDCKHRTPIYAKKGLPVVRPRDVKEDGINFVDCVRTTAEEFADLTEKHQPRRGDIVYSRNATFGVASLITTESKFAIGQDVCLIVSRGLNSVFLWFLLNSHFVRRQLGLVSSGSTFKRINLRAIRRLKILVPPLALQQHFAQIVDATERKKASQRADLAELDTLFNALVQRAFRGDL